LEAAPAPSYVYRADLVRILDGDTVEARVDLRFSVHTVQSLRFKDVFAAERFTANGRKHTAHLESLLAPGAWIIVRTYKNKTDKYGRYEADLWVVETGVHVNAAMRSFIGTPQGLGVPKR